MENEKQQQCPAIQPQQATHTDNRPQPAAGNGSQRLPYEAPAVEVIEVQTERGYAGSFDPWGPGGW